MFNKEELELIKRALQDYNLTLRINCIYCESPFKKETDDCLSKTCAIKECRKEAERLKEKIEEVTKWNLQEQET